MYVVDTLNTQHSDKPSFTKKGLITYMMTTLWVRIPLCERHVHHRIRHGTHMVGLSYWPASIIIHWVMPLPWHYPAFSYMKPQKKDRISCVIHKRWRPMRLFFAVGGGRKTNNENLWSCLDDGYGAITFCPKIMTQTCTNLTFIAVLNMETMDW
jgi:hypothetical protein